MGRRREYKAKALSIQKEIMNLIQQLENTGISVNDFENVNTFLENISNIIFKLGISLPSLCMERIPVDFDLMTSVGDSSLSESEQKTMESWVGQLRRLRASSISLLSGRSIEEVESKGNQARKGTKRKLKDDESESGKKKIRKAHPENESGNGRGAKLGLFEHCYICKSPTSTRVDLRHSFYPWMCPPCGDLNYQKRTQSADLDGKIALVTGGRIKIGYEIVLKLLRAGARVVVTTRFPNDALRRFEKELDFPAFASRLHFYGLDLRFLPQVEEFCEHFVKEFGRLDILIQNAAQTIRKPTIYYQKLIEGEQQNTLGNSRNFVTSSSSSKGKAESGDIGICDVDVETKSHALSSTPLLGVSEKKENCLSVPHSNSSQLLIHSEDFKYMSDPILAEQHFPSGQTDSDGNQLDLRSSNSWILKLEQVELSEMIEVTLTNYISPFVILQKLTPIFKRDNTRLADIGFIVLVSAMEGKFQNCWKTGSHPHTNGAKAGLNMLVRTCGREYYRELGIAMNAVDTGWVTEEHPMGWKTKFNPKYPTPLDSIDGAARVLDPIFTTINNQNQYPIYGKFIKDYQPTDW